MLSMQNAITTQFLNFGVVLLQNLQQTHMTMLGAIVAPILVATLAPLALVHQLQPLEPIPTPPPSSPPPQFQD